MDVVLLSRIQFALAAGFHFLFPPLTLGLTLIIFMLETMFLRKGAIIFKEISNFLIKILALIFTVGVASGIVLEFSFGTNWAEYSRMVGDIFGAPLAAEAVFSFFLESTFIAVLLFGRNKVSPKAYWLVSFLIFFASHLSGLWIIIANSWMQTPAGFEIVNGRAVLTDFFAAAFSPSTLVRYTHTVCASWVTGSLFAAGISAWFLLRKRNAELFKPLLHMSLTIFIITGLLQTVTGHAHAVQVAKTQPAKMAAFEALWQTQNGAPMSLFGIPDAEQQKTHFQIKIPKLLSFMINFNFDSEVKGLNEFPKEEWPPVSISYFSYHLMIVFGGIFAFLSVISIIMLVAKKFNKTNWFLKVLMISAPFPLAINIIGWTAAEVGRQPWAVYGILKTADAASVSVPAWQVLFTLILFSLVYLLLFTVFLIVFTKIIKKGPESIFQAAE